MTNNERTFFADDTTMVELRGGTILDVGPDTMRIRLSTGAVRVFYFRRTAPLYEPPVMLGHECVCGHLVGNHQEVSWKTGGGIGRGQCQVKYCPCQRPDTRRG